MSAPGASRDDQNLCSPEPMETNETDASPAAWWGAFTLEEKTGGRWNVGPSTLWLYRTQREWIVAHRPSVDPKSPDPMANRSEFTVPVDDGEVTRLFEADDDRVAIHRYSFQRTEERVDLEPALADRPIVARPEHPLHVPSGETVTLYLSTPLWMRVVLPETDRLITELPSHRMSDTWFGTSTVSGELCYATRTAGRLRREELPVRKHRALTPLRIENNAQDALLLERVQLPIRHLALYETPDDNLWTQAVQMTRQAGSQGAEIEIRSGAPDDAGQAEILQKPRDPDKRGLFTSTFSAFEVLFGS